ncbi:unnamed protein product, partial [Discosporangium mesarthrocarpum]
MSRRFLPIDEDEEGGGVEEDFSSFLPMMSASDSLVEAAAPDPRKDPEYAKYFRMLDSGLPRTSVERTMVLEGKYPAVLNTPKPPSPMFLSPMPPSPATPAGLRSGGGGGSGGAAGGGEGQALVTPVSPASPVSRPVAAAVAAAAAAEAAMATLVPARDHPLYSRFYEMVRGGSHREEVIQVMQEAGLDEAVLDVPDALFPLEVAVAGAGVGAAVGKGDRLATKMVPAKDHPTFRKFFKMLSMGLPHGAAVQAMTKEELDTAILDTPDAMFPLPPEEGEGAAGATAGAAAGAGPKMVPAKDHPTYKKFFKMLSMG